MTITKEEVQYVANLARLELSNAEEALFADQLGKIIGFVDHLKDADIEGVAPYISAASSGNVFRADLPHSPLPRAKALANAPEQDGEGFIVPKVVDSGSGA